jgi:hypothetical protein
VPQSWGYRAKGPHPATARTPTGGCTRSRSRNCDQFHRPWLYTESMDERLTRHTALHFNQKEPHYGDPCPGHGGSLRAPMEQGPQYGWKQSKRPGLYGRLKTKRFRTQSHCSKVAPPTLKIMSMSSSIFLRALGDWPARNWFFS